MSAAIQRPARVHKTKSADPQLLEVAVVTHYFNEHGGGIEIVAERLIREITAFGGIHFTWMASNTDPAPNMDGATMLPVPSWNFSEKLLGFPWPIWSPRALKSLRETIKRSDIVWLHDTLYFGNIMAMRYAKKVGKPVLITQHIAPIPYRNPLLRVMMRIADRFFTSKMLERAYEVTFISDRVAEEYYARIPFQRPIKIIPNGVDIRSFYPAMSENRRFLRQKFALKDDQIVVLFVGRFVEKKGLEVIRRLADQLPAWRFWLAGAGQINPDSWMLPNVHVLKGRKGQSLAELYQSADLMIIPSYGEGFPLVIQEAMACGLPVLCGPSTAQGNALAAPYLHTADVWPNDPKRTTAVWLEKLQNFPVKLPLKKPVEKIADFALRTWDWPPIAQVYADILTAAAKKN